MIVNYGNTIPDFVKKYREYCGYSQSDLAKLLGVHGQYVSNIERGEITKPVGFCKRLMKKLDTRRQNHLEELLREAVLSDLLDEV